MTSGRLSDSAPRAAIVGLAITIVLIALALSPGAIGWVVNADNFPPLHATLRPRVGPGTIPAVAIAVAAVVFAQRLALRLRWRWLMLGSFVVGVAWMLS